MVFSSYEFIFYSILTHCHHNYFNLGKYFSPKVQHIYQESSSLFLWLLCWLIVSTLIYIIILPPYSALYWHYINQQGYQDDFINFKKYLVKKLSDFYNVRVVDMQYIDEITDLNYYKDLSHFNTDIQELIVDCIRDRSKDVSERNLEDHINRLLDLVLQISFGHINRLLDLVASFESDNKDWIY